MTHSPIGGTPPASALDQFLRNSYDVVQKVHHNLPAIQAVAEHLTPVEDLLEFRNEVEELHAKLGLLVAASQIIIRATEAGLDLLIAENAAAQRVLLGIKSAALYERSYFATKSEFDVLMAQVVALSDVVDGILATLANKADRSELQELRDLFEGMIQELEDRLGDFDAGTGNLGGRLTYIEQALQDGIYWDILQQRTALLEIALDNPLTGNTALATALQQLTVRITESEEGILVVASDLTELVTRVANAETGLEGEATARNLLESRTSILEGTVTAQASDITTLQVSTANANTQLEAQGTAIGGLSTRIDQNDASVLVVSSDISQLGSRVTDAETGITAAATALSELTTQVEQTADQLVITSEDITELTASITGTGNNLPNSGFESDLSGWTLFSRGPGWLAAQLIHNLDPDRLPPGVSSLSLYPSGVPSGDAGVRSRRIPVTPNGKLILSGYLAAENCTARLEWRLFDSDGVEVGFGLAGEATDVAPSNSLADWDRSHALVTVPHDAIQMEVQLWVVDAHNSTPKAWLLRPMVEEATGGQNRPSPWVDSVSGLAETWATALQTLSVRVEQAEDFIDSWAGAETNLSARIGSLAEYRVTTHMGSGDADSVGSPRDPVLSLARAGSPVAHTFQRGLTLVRFNVNSEVDTATRYDTYASATERNNLRDALNAMGPEDSFLLVAQNHHGIKQADLTAALERNGAYGFANVVGSRPYILLGQGGIGKGNGIEVFPTGSATWIDHYFSMVGDTPKGLGAQSGLVEDLYGTANAVQSLDVRVTATEGEISTVSSAQTALDVRLETTEAALIQEMITSANKDAALTATTNQLSADMLVLDSNVTAQGGVLSGIQVELTNLDGTVTSHTSQLTSLQAQVDSMDTDSGGFGAAISELDTRVTSAEDELASQGTAITALENSVTSANKIFAQNNPPATAGRTMGDLWFDTNDKNKPYIFNGTSWVLRQDMTKNTIFVQGTQPTANNVNDLWVDTSRNNRQFRWTGSTWAEVSDTRVVSTANALSSLTTRVTSAEGVNTSQGQQITTLQNTVNHSTTGVAANASAVSSLTNRVTTAEGNISTTSSSLTTLTNKVNHSTTGLAATANAVGGLTTRVTSAEGTISSHTGSITNLTSRVGSVESVNSSQASAISTLQTRATNIEGVNSSQASSISTLQSTTGSMQSTISSVQSVATSANNTAKAIIGLTSNTNGLISGYKSVNNGTTSSFSILATVFRVITSGNTGLEWQNGYLRAYSGSIQLVLGINFGASSNLCFWYGPNVGANSCTKNNGTIWFDNTGSAYFGGTLSAGILRNGAQSTQVSNRATVETGRFGTNGSRKVVTYSLSYYNGGMTTSSSQRPTAGSISGTVRLERRRNGTGTWTQVSSMTASGSIEHISEPGGAIVSVSLGGSSTYTDNSTGTQDFEYRARITAHSGAWPWINPVGSAGQQSLSIISIEE